MLKDRYDNLLSTDSAPARDAYIEAVDLFLSSNAGVDDMFQKALDADEKFCLAHLGRARNFQSIGHGAAALESLAAARAVSQDVSEGEQAQLELLGMLIEGKGSSAYPLIRQHLLTFPRDALLAQTCMGVFSLIGFSGQPGRESEHLAFTTSLQPHYGEDWWFLAQQAFAQIEVGMTHLAESTIEKAQEANPRNANMSHYKSHIHYELGQHEAGFKFLDHWMKSYDKQGLLHCHISWHLGLWSLARGDIDAMWQIVDRDVAPGGAWGPPLNVLTDTAAILFRANIAGVEIDSSRWLKVSDYALKYFPKPGIAFADAHAALAHAMAGNSAALLKIVKDAKGPAADQVKCLAAAFLAFSIEDWDRAIHELTIALRDHARIGGSRAQRDLIEFAMLCCLLKQGQSDEAQRMLSTRRPLIQAANLISGLATD